MGAEDDFWTTVIDQLDLFQTTEIANGKGSTAKISASGTAIANFFVAKGEAKVGGSYGTSKSKSSRTRAVSSRVAAMAGLRDAHRAIVIDDFHYLPRERQGSLMRALKPLIFDGLPVVIIAIPHRRYDAVKVEKEMTGRILPVNIPAWSEEELAYIPKTGFPLLNGTLSDALTKTLSEQSVGSPHLVQEFCRAICREQGITTTFGGKAANLSRDGLNKVFGETAETIGRPIFEKLARGPRQRSDRIAWTKSGNEVDIRVNSPCSGTHQTRACHLGI